MTDIKILSAKLARAIANGNEIEAQKILEEIKKQGYTQNQVEELSNESAIDLEHLRGGLASDNKRIIKGLILENSTSSLSDFIKEKKKTEEKE